MQSNGSRGRKPHGRPGGHSTWQEPNDPEPHRDSPSRRRGWLDRARDTMEDPTVYSPSIPVSGIGSHVSQAILPGSAIGRVAEHRSAFEAKCGVSTLARLYATHLLDNQDIQWINYFSPEQGCMMKYNPVTGEIRSTAQSTEPNQAGMVASTPGQGSSSSLERARELVEQSMGEYDALYCALHTQSWGRSQYPWKTGRE